MGSEPKARAVEPEQRSGPEKKKVHALLYAAGLVLLLSCAHVHTLTATQSRCKFSRDNPCTGSTRVK